MAPKLLARPGDLSATFGLQHKDMMGHNFLLCFMIFRRSIEHSKNKGVNKNIPIML
jgi:hypothetical protein